MVRSRLICGFWEVDDEVEPIALFIIKPLGVTSTYYLYCYAMLVDVDWVSEIHDRCEFVKLMVYLRWQLKHTSGWIGCGHLGIYQCCPFFGSPPRLKGIIRLFMLETSVCSHKPLWALA